MRLGPSIERNKMKVGDKVRVIKQFSGPPAWSGAMNKTIGKTGIVSQVRWYAEDGWIKVKICGDEWVYPEDCLELVNEGTEMDALKLNVEAIRKRVLEQAVVAKFDGELTILIDRFFRDEETSDLIDLVGGWRTDADHCDWLIRPGDEAEFSDDGEDWTWGSYGGLHGRGMFDAIADDPCIFVDKARNVGWRFIRPVQKNPELDKAIEEVAEARRRLEKAEMHLEKINAR